jgi:hypothetical protein
MHRTFLRAMTVRLVYVGLRVYGRTRWLIGSPDVRAAREQERKVKPLWVASYM